MKFSTEEINSNDNNEIDINLIEDKENEEIDLINIDSNEEEESSNNVKKENTKSKNNNRNSINKYKSYKNDYDVILESNPKWYMLDEILNEIKSTPVPKKV
jgi:hypothetical protein